MDCNRNTEYGLNMDGIQDMSDGRRMAENRNKGFSLVELIVYILILSMVMGIVIMFIATSTNSYRMINDEVTMQTEADIAMNYINEIAVEAKDYRTEKYTNDSGVVCTALCMLAPDDIWEETGNPSKDYYYIVWHQNDEDELRFKKFGAVAGEPGYNILEPRAGLSEVGGINDLDINSTLNSAGAYDNSTKENFLARYVKEFLPVAPADVNVFPMLNVTISLEYDDKTYVAQKNMASRNLGLK